MLGSAVWALENRISGNSQQLSEVDTREGKGNESGNEMLLDRVSVEEDGVFLEEGSEREFFQAVVIEVEEEAFLVETLEGEEKWNSSVQIRIGKKEIISFEKVSELKVGDIVQIVFNGNIMETYPAQLGTVFAVNKVGEIEDFQHSQIEMLTAEYHYQYANMLLQLPADWEYEIVPAEQMEENSNRTFGIRFWPMADLDFQLELFYWMDGIGLCATGVTIEKIDFDNKMAATKFTETIDGKLWITIVYQNLPGTYVVSGTVPEKLWEKYEETLMEILESTELGKGNLTQEEVVEIALEAWIGEISMPEEVYKTWKDEKEFAGFYDRVRATFQCEDGRWKVEFYLSDTNDKQQVVWIDAEGTVLSMECGININNKEI